MSLRRGTIVGSEGSNWWVDEDRQTDDGDRRFVGRCISQSCIAIAVIALPPMRQLHGRNLGRHCPFAVQFWQDRAHQDLVDRTELCGRV